MRDIHSAKEVEYIVDKTRVGDTLTFKVLRGSQNKIDLKVRTVGISSLRDTFAPQGKPKEG